MTKPDTSLDARLPVRCGRRSHKNEDPQLPARNVRKMSSAELRLKGSVLFAEWSSEERRTENKHEISPCVTPVSLHQLLCLWSEQSFNLRTESFLFFVKSRGTKRHKIKAITAALRAVVKPCLLLGLRFISPLGTQLLYVTYVTWTSRSYVRVNRVSSPFIAFFCKGGINTK